MQKIWENHREKCILILAAVLLFLAFRYVLPLVMPIAIGAVLAALLRPAVSCLHEKTHLGKGILTLLLLAVIAVVIFFLAGLLGYGFLERLYRLWLDYESYKTTITEKAELCCAFLEGRLHLKEGYLMTELGNSAELWRTNLTKTVMPDMVNGSIACFKLTFSVSAFLIVLILSVVLITKDWDKLEQGALRKVFGYMDKVISFFKIYFVAQGKILSVIGVICFVGFMVAGFEGSFGLALFTACLDVLPFIGTGTILLPLAIWELISAEYGKMIVLLVTYVCCIITREYLEPKFISVKTGTSPLFMLVGIYVGVKVFGIVGIFAGPLYVLFLSLIYREVYAGKGLDNEKREFG